MRIREGKSSFGHTHEKAKEKSGKPTKKTPKFSLVGATSYSLIYIHRQLEKLRLIAKKINLGTSNFFYKLTSKSGS